MEYAVNVVLEPLDDSRDVRGKADSSELAAGGLAPFPVKVRIHHRWNYLDYLDGRALELLTQRQRVGVNRSLRRVVDGRGEHRHESEPRADVDYGSRWSGQQVLDEQRGQLHDGDEVDGDLVVAGCELGVALLEIDVPLDSGVVVELRKTAQHLCCELLSLLPICEIA